MSWAFVVTALVVVATPGTGAIFTIAAGLGRGPRAAVLAAFACTLGTIPHLVAALTGLAALLHASGVAFAVLKYAGVAYLLYLAWSTWQHRREPITDVDPRVDSWWRVIASGVTLNLLNPKLTLFFFAFLPQFAATSAPGATQRMLVLSGAFMVLTFAVFAGYGVCAGLLRERVLSRPRLVQRIQGFFAATFGALGLRLAFETR